MVGPVVVIVVFTVSILGILAYVSSIVAYSFLRWITVPTTGIKQTKQPFPDRILIAGIRMFVDEWEVAFGKNTDVREACDNLRIEWFLADDFAVPGQSTMRAYGENPSGNYLRLTSRLSDNLADTALFHELIHVALRAVQGSPDSDHEGRRLPGWEKEHTALERRVKARFVEWWAEQPENRAA